MVGGRLKRVGTLNVSRDRRCCTHMKADFLMHSNHRPFCYFYSTVWPFPQRASEALWSVSFCSGVSTPVIFRRKWDWSVRNVIDAPDSVVAIESVVDGAASEDGRSIVLNHRGPASNVNSNTLSCG